MSLNQALFTPAQSKVLEWLFGQPQRWFHIQELMRLTSLASASLQREVKRLHDAGLVVEERIGNLRRVQANPNSPVFKEMVSLVSKTMGAIPAITEALAPLAGRLQLALVFGSVAKGTDHAGSDVDVLVVSNSLSLQDLLTVLLPVEERIARRVEVKLYTEEEFKARRDEVGSVVNRIIAEPHTLLYGGVE